jgi:glycosyltransferase involved in cell wall biosynthesis
MRKPFFSVIIPFYNRYFLLWNCLVSLQRQTFDDFEVLVCKDGSYDAQLEKLLAHCSCDAKIVYSSRLGRPARSRNAGALAASGRYLAFCDDDDSFAPSKLESSYNAIASKGDVFLAHKVAYFSGSGLDVYETMVPTYSNSFSVQTRVNALFRQICLGNQLIVSSFVIDRNLHFSLGGFDEVMLTGEDYLYSVSAIRKCSLFIFLDASLGGYRIEASPKLKHYVPGKSSNDRQTSLELIRALSADASFPFLLLRAYLLLAYALLCFEDVCPSRRIIAISYFIRKAIGLAVVKLSGGFLRFSTKC